MRTISSLLIILLLASLSCNLSKSDSSGNQIAVDAPLTVAMRPQTTTVAVGQALIVEVEARDPTDIGITRIELLVNGQIVDVKTPAEAADTQAFVANLTWTPGTRSIGAVTLAVRAWRNGTSGSSQTQQVTVTNSPIATSTQAGGINYTPSAPTLEACSVNIDTQGLRLRSVPDTSSDDTIIKNFNLNDKALVLGRLSDSSWYQVQDNAQIGWVFAGYTTLQGNCGVIQVVSAPTTPTPAPTLTPIVTQPGPTSVDLIALPISGNVSVELDQSGTATHTYSLVIQNIGTGPSGAFQVQVVLPGGEEQIRQVNNLAAGELLTLDEGAAVTFNTPGTQQISVNVDFDNRVNETNESNNFALLTVIVSAPTDTNSE